MNLPGEWMSEWVRVYSIYDSDKWGSDKRRSTVIICVVGRVTMIIICVVGRAMIIICVVGRVTMNKNKKYFAGR